MGGFYLLFLMFNLVTLNVPLIIILITSFLFCLQLFAKILMINPGLLMKLLLNLTNSKIYTPCVIIAMMQSLGNYIRSRKRSIRLCLKQQELLIMTTGYLILTAIEPR